MQIGMIGLNHKLANLELRETIARACQRSFSLGDTGFIKASLIILTTCNRSEIYFSSEDLAYTHSLLLNLLRITVPESFDQKIYSYFGQDCFHHLARVTTGLDSAIPFETEIQGQVKTAYEQAQEYTCLPRELHYLFQKALKIGKQVRTEFSFFKKFPNLEQAIFQTGVQLFQNPLQSQILLVGASEINCKILAFFKSKKFENITICNRTLNKSEALKEAHNISILPWNEVLKWPNYDWIIFGTKAPYYIATPQDLSNKEIEKKLIIDLSVPRNVAPTIRHEKIHLFNIDQINRVIKYRKQNLSKILQQAENLVCSASNKHIEIFEIKNSSLVI